MTWLKDDPETFMDEFLTGFAAAHRGSVVPVPGSGVRRRYLPESPQVAVITGGGSGHYPAFAGVVGDGLAHAAVCGNIFASPSAAQVESVVKASSMGRGVLLSFGNYAGDVLHFGLAERQLRAQGFDVRTVLVTDDVASAPIEQRELRRGIAGDLVVFKIAGAASARGDSLDEVERLARRANARTVSMGVAFHGCTLPGATEPLFEVPPGMMSVGMGIHGEPGISEAPLPGASELAETLVDALTAEKPHGSGNRVAVLVNGLGSVPYEEIFAVYGHVAKLLEKMGLDIVGGQSGELVTSLDMAGMSLTITWLDDELEPLWLAPADAPAFVRMSSTRGSGPEALQAQENPLTETENGTAFSYPNSHSELAKATTEILNSARVLAEERYRDWGQLDSFAGDGDHGIGMRRGIQAASSNQDPQSIGAAEILAHAGRAFADAAGGTSGAIWGIILGSLADTLGNTEKPGPLTIRDAVQRAYDDVRELGGARPGDKTIVDALHALNEALREGVDAEDPASVQAWLANAVQVTAQAAQDTANLLPQRGRARPLAEKSKGHPDPGATSFAEITGIVLPALVRPAQQAGHTPS